MGCDQRKQPDVRKVGIGPAVMIKATSPTTSSAAFAQNRSQTHSDPAVQGRELVMMAVLVVCKPASQHPVQFSGNELKAMTVGPLRLGSDRVFQLLQALVPWPAMPGVEVIAEKVETLGLCFDDAGLLRMQNQSGFRRPLLHDRQCLLCFQAGATHDHESSSPGESHPQALTEPDVNLSAHPAPIVQLIHQVPPISG